MAMTRYTGVEVKPELDVLTPQQHQAAQAALRGMGKNSARDLTDNEREQFRVSVDRTQ